MSMTSVRIGQPGCRFDLEIVSSCWRYWRCLAFHLSQFVVRPPGFNTQVTVFFCDEDQETKAVLQFFGSIRRARVFWNWQQIPRTHLMRRAIARNLAARGSKAEFVIFTDVDYLYSGENIDLIVTELREHHHECLWFTPAVFGNIDESAGDCELSRLATIPDLHVIEPKGVYIARPIDRPIGGSQIVTGRFANQHGYLPHHNTYQRPSETWQRTTEDPVFRKTCGLSIKPLFSPSVLRIRHTQKGRTHHDCNN